MVLFGVITIIFLLFILMPNPARVQMGQRGTGETLKLLEEQFGLNDPWQVRMKNYLADLSPVSSHTLTPLKQKEYNYKVLFKTKNNRGVVLKRPYLGRSFQNRQPVMDILMDRLPPTIILAISSMVLAFIIGVFLGVLAAIKHNTWIDNLTVSVSTMGISVPSYFSAIILMYFIGVALKDVFHLPMQGSLFDPISGNMQIQNLILPAIALGVRPVSIITQLTRSAMLDTLSSDFIRTAKAKGLSNNKVIFKHALRNALNPVVTAASGWFASLLAGAFFVESIFNYVGLGYETVNALKSFDFPLVMGSVIISAAFFVIILLLTDILYSILDKRISLGST